MDALDEKVIVFKEEHEKEDEAQAEEKVDPIDDEVQRIINSKIEQNELIEIVTTPRVLDVSADDEAAAALPEIDRKGDPTDVSDVELNDDEYESIPLPTADSLLNDDEPSSAPSAKKVEPATPAPQTEREEEESKLKGLVDIVNAAIADDSGTTKEDLSELMKIIKEAKSNGFPDPKDQAVLEECIYNIMDYYYNR